MFDVPELLAPAGSYEKLEVAIRYGADAVYLGGQKFGLRTASDNFTDLELLKASDFVHDYESKVFVVLNSFFHDKDFLELPSFISILNKAKVDALIVSDIGVINFLKDHTDIEIHLSTQASCLNVEAAKFWKQQNVKRVVLGREVSIEEASFIKKESGLEVELFIHGAMCMAYSGNCVISNYTQGRDSNRGGCAHSCRFEYDISFDQKAESKKAFFMSSKDLNGIMLLNHFVKNKIDSLKIEGRMKSEHYVGTVTKIYREALDEIKEKGFIDEKNLIELQKDLHKISHRDYTQASLLEPAGSQSIFDEREHVEGDVKVAGIVIESKPDEHLLVQVRSPIFPEQKLAALGFRGKEKELSVNKLVNMNGTVLEKANPGMLIKIPYIKGVERYNLIRSYQ